MTEYHVMYWRDLPSMVVARDGDCVAKQPLPDRFHEAIDAAAEHVADDDSNAALAGWRRTSWAATEGVPDAVVHEVAAELAEEWPDEAIETYLSDMDVTLEVAS